MACRGAEVNHWDKGRNLVNNKWQFTYLKLAIQLFESFLKLWIDFSHDGGVGRCGRCKDEVWWVYLRLATDLSLTGPVQLVQLKGPDGIAESRDVVSTQALEGRQEIALIGSLDRARWIKGRGAPGLFWLYHHSNQFFLAENTVPCGFILPLPLFSCSFKHMLATKFSGWSLF
jgi:hypothetical protein